MNSANSISLGWLRERRRSRLAELYEWADDVRRQHVGDAVHLRGLIESQAIAGGSACIAGCAQANRALPRYRMTQRRNPGLRAPGRAAGLRHRRDAGRRRRSAHRRVDRGDRALDQARDALAVTLSLGERSDRRTAAVARGRRRPLSAAL